ncbi:four helix bundle protein [Candidatus Parcubacteria bacterium]|nr:MAG: four helix bundle protein [Candidatus Parcubacteria bacterium]
MKYDLEERTIMFSKSVIRLLKNIRLNEYNRNIISQLIRSATSVGANYCEANGASSKKDFRNKIYICKKEIKETRYWIEILAEINCEEKKKLRIIWSEAHELTLIFNKISNSLK